jgi:hypothetical protein
VGLVAYPAQGVSKSIRTAMKISTRKIITDAKLAEGEWLAKSETGQRLDRQSLIAEFEVLRNGRGDS